MMTTMYLHSLNPQWLLVVTEFIQRCPELSSCPTQHMIPHPCLDKACCCNPLLLTEADNVLCSGPPPIKPSRHGKISISYLWSMRIQPGPESGGAHL